MLASVHATATLMQPSKLVVSIRTASSQLRSSLTLSKAFGVEYSGARLTCSLHSDLKDVARKFSYAAKIANFALATSDLVVSVVLTQNYVMCFNSTRILNYTSLNKSSSAPG